MKVIIIDKRNFSHKDLTDISSLAKELMTSVEKRTGEEYSEYSISGSKLLKEIETELAHRERVVIKHIMRFDLNSIDINAFERAAQELGVTRERVRQIRAKAVRKLARKSELYVEKKKK